MVRVQKEKREQMETDAWNNIDQIKEQNKEQLTLITEAGLKSKADLQLISNKYKDAKNRKDGLVRDINENKNKLASQI